MKMTMLTMAWVAALGVMTSCGKSPVTYGQGDVQIRIERGEEWLHDFPLFWGIKVKNPPQMAIWAEDVEGNYLSTIYVTQKIATEGWMANEGNIRKEALPTWCHAHGGQPTKKQPLVDGLSGATPKADFDVKLRPVGNSKRFVIKIEVNHSTDWNDNYPKDAAEGTMGYSGGGTGGSGQPAVVYAAEIDLDSPHKTCVAALLGHSSPDGTSGEIDPDTSSLTSALSIVKRITIDIQ